MFGYVARTLKIAHKYPINQKECPIKLNKPFFFMRHGTYSKNFTPFPTFANLSENSYTQVTVCHRNYDGHETLILLL